MNKHEIQTNWTGDGLTLATAYRPQFAVDHPGIKWSDKSGGVPGPALKAGGAVKLEIEATQAQVDAIKAGGKYDPKPTD